MRFGDNLADHHIWSVEACGLYFPSLRILPCDQSNYYLQYSVRGCGRPQAHDVVSKAVFAIHCVRVFVSFSSMRSYFPIFNTRSACGRLKTRPSRMLYIPRFISGAGQPESRLWRRRVNPVTEMV